jgi:hypothetical protein
MGHVRQREPIGQRCETIAHLIFPDIPDSFVVSQNTTAVNEPLALLAWLACALQLNRLLDGSYRVVLGDNNGEHM